MGLRFQEAKDLPPGATGFRLVDENHPERTMFFHWHTDPVEHTHTAYADVLRALPDRLAAVGYEDEVDAICGEVIARFGAGVGAPKAARSRKR